MTYLPTTVYLKLKGLSSKMEGAIKVVSINNGLRGIQFCMLNDQCAIYILSFQCLNFHPATCLVQGFFPRGHEDISIIQKYIDKVSLK